MTSIRKQVAAISFTGFCALVGGCAETGVSHGPPELAIPLTADMSLPPITSHDLVTIRDIGGYSGNITVSPDGQSVAFQIQQADPETDTYQTSWFAASTAGGANSVIWLGDGGEVILSGEETSFINGDRAEMKARWSPNSQWIAYRVKKQGQIQLWRSSRDGRIQEQLTHNAANISDFAWSFDSEKIFFRVGWSRDGRQSALAKDGENGYLFDERLYPFAAYSVAPVFSEAAYDQAMDQGHVSGVWIYDVKTSSERPATDDEEADYAALTAATKLPHKDIVRGIRHVTPFEDFSAFAWIEKAMPENREGAVAYTVHMIPKDGEEIRCEASQCTGRLGGFIWSDLGNELYFVRYGGEGLVKSTFYAWNWEAGEVREILSTDDKITNCELAVGQLVCLHESATTPRKIVTIDPADGVTRTIVDPNPEFQRYEFTPVEPLEWKETHTGVAAGGHLVYPINYQPGKRYPLIIVQYRSHGFLRGGVGNEFPIHPLAANGFFVLSFDRPERPFPADAKDIWDREKGDWGEDLWERSATLSALEVIIEQLDERGLIDPDRVGITGLSDGAETVWYAMMHSNHFTVAAASSGGWSPNWYYLVNQERREGYFNRAAELLPPGMGGDERWKRISPEFHADTIDVPILVQVADSELIMSSASIGALMDAGKPIETYVFPDEYHIKWQPKHKLAVYERSIDWMNFWLRDIEDPAPEKAEQYTRWRKLRDERCARTDLNTPSYCQS